jgi:uncharacterized SAM-binding protein YcdF (DUF218 family)
LSLFLDKLLPVFVFPLGAAILLGVAALVLSLARYRRLASLVLASDLAVLWLAATPIFADWLTFRLESQYPPRRIEDLPAADVVVLLGGVLGQPLPPRMTSDLGDPADRILHAWRLLRADKANFILISAGNVPWQSAVAPEAKLIADLLIELGAPESGLVLETESRNTRENAVNAAAIFRERGWRTGLLVTSGAHMPRALATFRTAGLDVRPASTDVGARLPLYDSALDFLPDAGALARTTSAVRELIGLAVYQYRRWA